MARAVANARACVRAWRMSVCVCADTAFVAQVVADLPTLVAQLPTISCAKPKPYAFVRDRLLRNAIGRKTSSCDTTAPPPPTTYDENNSVL
jgi:hypothetical protein